MKKIIVLILIAITAAVSPVASHAISNALKQAEKEMNANCPLNCGDGLSITKFAFTDDNIFQIHFKSQDFAGYTKNMITAENRKDFREGFASEFGADNEIVKICKEYGLRLMIVMYNPSGQELFREIFRYSDFK